MVWNGRCEVREYVRRKVVVGLVEMAKRERGGLMDSSFGDFRCLSRFFRWPSTCR